MELYKKLYILGRLRDTATINRKSIRSGVFFFAARNYHLDGNTLVSFLGCTFCVPRPRHHRIAFRLRLAVEKD